MKMLAKILIIASSMALAAPAMAAVQITNSDGLLIGASGVIIGNNLYDVRFLGGTCTEVFGSCNRSSFDFTTLGAASSALVALRDQVFIDTAKGAFDSIPSLTFGCQGGAISCRTFIPAETAGNFANGLSLTNRSLSSVDLIGRDGVGFNENLPSNGVGHFARFTLTGPLPSTLPAVPEPSTWALMLAGFGMVGYALRRRKVAFA